MRVPAPLNWFGSKSKLASQIIKHFPAHRTYAEPFGGSAAVLFAKEPAKVEVYNDLDRELLNFFRVLRDRKLSAQLHAAAQHTPYARAEFDLAQQHSDDPVESARRFLVRHRMSFGGMGRDWCYSISTSRKGTAAAIRRWRWGVDAIPAIYERLRSVQIECSDWRDVMARYDGADTLFFCDPPYVPETRVAGTYRHELTEDRHRQLVAFLLSMRGMAVVSGYAHSVYLPLQKAGWVRIDYPTCTHALGSLTRRIECVWLSPSVTLSGQNGIPLSPRERMSRGAHHAHKVMVMGTTKRLIREIERLRAEGKKPTATNLARTTRMSREHLVRKYRHLFADAKV